jgi:hypothetical protein
MKGFQAIKNTFSYVNNVYLQQNKANLEKFSLLSI